MRPLQALLQRTAFQRSRGASSISCVWGVCARARPLLLVARRHSGGSDVFESLRRPGNRAFDAESEREADRHPFFRSTLKSGVFGFAFAWRARKQRQSSGKAGRSFGKLCLQLALQARVLCARPRPPPPPPPAPSSAQRAAVCQRHRRRDGRKLGEEWADKADVTDATGACTTHTLFSSARRTLRHTHKTLPRQTASLHVLCHQHTAKRIEADIESFSLFPSARPDLA
jgi:hypothetical protein